MEPRKITVIQTKGQGKKVFMSGAEKLGELKKDFDSQGISYTDMMFYEGISRTELVDNESILPKDIPFRDIVTNELVIYLTLKQKKIRSGMAMTRTEAYALVKDNNLGDEVKKKFGKNYTQVKTDELISFLSSKGVKEGTKTSTPDPVKKSSEQSKRPDVDSSKKEETKPVDKSVEKKEAPKKEDAPVVTVDSEKVVKLTATLSRLIDILEYGSVISDDEKDELLDLLNSDITVEETEIKEEAPKKEPDLTSSYSDSDLDALAPKY